MSFPLDQTFRLPPHNFPDCNRKIVRHPPQLQPSVYPNPFCMAMIQQIQISGYRSLAEISLELGKVTIVQGKNGTGKSNLYKSLKLLSRLAQGDLAKAVSEEGGMPSLLWSGNGEVQRSTTWETTITHDQFTYELVCGLPPSRSSETAFFLDPDIKNESLSILLRKNKKLVARRKNGRFQSLNISGVMEDDRGLRPSRSMLADLQDVERHPFLALARQNLARWRFYEEFRTDFAAPARQAIAGHWSGSLADDGSNLASAIQSIRESDKAEIFEQAVQMAFPGAVVEIATDRIFSLSLHSQHLPRSMDVHELSDGTLRFLCLAAALCAPDAPDFLVLNEPENSLNETILSALSYLIAEASAHSQILIVTHSSRLGDDLSSLPDCRRYELVNKNGATRLKGQEGGRRCIVIRKGKGSEEE